MEIKVNEYPVEMLSSNLQVTGTLSTRGQPPLYINDQQVSILTIEDATVTPLMTGARIGPMNVPATYVPKTWVDILLIGDFSVSDISLLPNTFRLICFTASYAVRATFHGGVEMQAADVFGSRTGPFLPVTDAEVFAIRPLAVEVGGTADLIFLNQQSIQAYHAIP
jgi:hypothetical protein